MHVILDRAHFTSLRRLRIEAARILQSGLAWRLLRLRHWPLQLFSVPTLAATNRIGWTRPLVSKFARLPLDQLRAATTHAVFLFYYVLLHFWFMCCCTFG
jgi:hypothetical protein